MGREKDRKLRRRRRRKKKISKLKSRLEEAKSIESQKHLVEKLRRISVNPEGVIPEEFHKLLESS